MHASSRTRARPHITATDRRILRLAIPALGALAVEPLYVLVDTAIVGRLGTEQLAGLALAATALSLVVAGSNFLTYGTTERVARRIGAGDRTAAAEVGVQALWLSLLVGMTAAPLLMVLASSISRTLGGSGDILGFAEEYLQIRALGIPFVVLTLAAQGIMRGVSDYRTPLVILLAANAVNVVLELAFVFGLGLGVAGAAWSTVISQVGAGLVFAAVVRRRIAAARSRRPEWAAMAPLISAGRHLVLRVAAMLVVFGGATAIAARIDAPTLAAHQIAMSLFLLTALTLDALAVPAQTLVAEELGRGDVGGAAHVAGRAVRLSAGAGLVVALLVAVSAPVIPLIFTSDGAVASRATAALWVLAAMMVPAAFAFAHDGILIGAGDYRFLGLAAVGYLVAAIPLGLLVLVVDGLGITGVWMAMAAWVLLRAVVNHHRTGAVLC